MASTAQDRSPRPTDANRRTSYALLGHACFDRVPGSPGLVLGGTVFYAAVQALRQGADVTLVTRASAELEGRLREGLPAGVRFDVTRAPDDTVFVFDRDVSKGPMSCDSVSTGVRHRFERSHNIVHVAPLLDDIDGGTWESARASAACLGLTAQGFLRQIGPDGRIREAVAGGLSMVVNADVIAVNQREFNVMRTAFPVGDFSGLLLVTMGRLGAAVFHRAREIGRSVPPATLPEATNVIGAGDVFSAAFLMATSTGQAPKAALGSAADHVHEFLSARSGRLTPTSNSQEGRR